LKRSRVSLKSPEKNWWRNLHDVAGGVYLMFDPVSFFSFPEATPEEKTLEISLKMGFLIVFWGKN